MSGQYAFVPCDILMSKPHRTKGKLHITALYITPLNLNDMTLLVKRRSVTYPQGQASTSVKPLEHFLKTLKDYMKIYCLQI